MSEVKEKTHYRKAFNSPYLSSADIVGATILTVAYVALELDRTKKTKESFNTIHFVEKEIRKGEQLKPMILNAGNSKVMANVCGSKFIDDWQNIAITVFVDPNVRFGRDTVEGLRINPKRPQVEKLPLKPGTQRWDNAVEAFKRDGNLDKVRARMFVSDEHASLIGKEAAQDGVS